MAMTSAAWQSVSRLKLKFEVDQLKEIRFVFGKEIKGPAGAKDS